jgi:hypothetical protein
LVRIERVLKSGEYFEKTLARANKSPYCQRMDSNIELLATVGMSETFNPADAPDEGAWREAMNETHAPTERIQAALQAAWDEAFRPRPQ